MNNKLLLISKILLIITNSVLVAITLLDHLWSIEYGYFVLLYPLIAISIVSFFKPKLGGILLLIATILTFLDYVWWVLTFFYEFHLVDILNPIPLTLIFYLIISILLIVFSGKKKENETELGGIRC